MFESYGSYGDWLDKSRATCFTSSKQMLVASTHLLVVLLFDVPHPLLGEHNE